MEGSPDLSWDVPSGQKLSPALQSYHSDILVFMTQPPDGFEVLRQRLRNLPKLSSANPEPLIHNLEADMVYNTGGDLALVPPVLRKYWSRFLNQGPFGSWQNAVSWYRSLSRNDRILAGKFLGFEHLDLRPYNITGTQDLAGVTLASHRELLVREERQRLFDLADQFDLLVGEAQKEENFGFWRGYLRDKVDLHRRHPEYMASLRLERAPSLAGALEFTVDLIGRSPEDQVDRLRAVNVVKSAGGEPASQPWFIGGYTPLIQPCCFERTGYGPESVCRHVAAQSVDDIDPALLKFTQFDFRAGRPAAVIHALGRAVGQHLVGFREGMANDLRHPRAFGLNASHFQRRHDESRRLLLIAWQHGEISCIVAAGGIKQAPVIAEVVDVDG